MNESLANADLPDRLCIAWPADEWRNVHVLAAASGGADSMALLAALAEAKRRVAGSGALYVGHVNHALRGDDSDGDERWLREWCDSQGLRLLVRRCDTAALAAAAGDGIEAAARTARYQSLTEVAESVGARFVATAHTRDDQIETTLLRILRGTGLRGLAGMVASRPLSPSVMLVRPLLGLARRELVGFLNAIEQDFREDGSNADPQFARNRVRNDLLPYLRAQFNSAVDDAIARLGELGAEADSTLRTIAARMLAEAYVGGKASKQAFTLDVDALADEPELLMCEVVRLAWKEAGLGEQAMTARWWRCLAGLAQGSGDAPAINLPGNVIARRQGALLSVRRMAGS